MKRVKWDHRKNDEAARYQGPSGTRLTIHRHIDYPGRWLVSCHDAGVDRALLSAMDLESAKVEGVGVVRDRLLAVLADLPPGARP